MSFAVQKNILQFDVSVHNAKLYKHKEHSHYIPATLVNLGNCFMQNETVMPTLNGNQVHKLFWVTLGKEVRFDSNNIVLYR